MCFIKFGKKESNESFLDQKVAVRKEVKTSPTLRGKLNTSLFFTYVP